MKVAVGITQMDKPFGEVYWASCLRENFTSSSYGEGLETGRALAQTPRQSFTRQNKLSEIVHFFNVNALSSPIMIRIHFDLLWIIIADTLYLLLAKDLRRFENCSPQKLFKQFIDMPGQIDYDGKRFTVRIRKRATTPILLGVDKLNKEIVVPWLDNKPLRIIWTP